MKLQRIYLSCVIFLVSCQVKENKIITPRSGYSIIWRYKIKPENKERFEYEYGPRGTWFKLFSESINYAGSYLSRSEEEAGTYILIDTWTDKKSYEDFKDENRETYNRLSSGFEKLYEREEKVGSFDSVK
jgi:hypothetical protein